MRLFWAGPGVKIITQSQSKRANPPGEHNIPLEIAESFPELRAGESRAPTSTKTQEKKKKRATLNVSAQCHLVASIRKAVAEPRLSDQSLRVFRFPVFLVSFCAAGQSNPGLYTWYASALPPRCTPVTFKN